MALINITIEKVIVKQNEDVLNEILCLVRELSGCDKHLKQEIMNKLDKLIVDVKSTV